MSFDNCMHTAIYMPTKLRIFITAESFYLSLSNQSFCLFTDLEANSSGFYSHREF